MNVLKSSLFMLILIIIFSCAKTKYNNLDSISISDFGAVPNDNQDDSEAFKKAIIKAQSLGGIEVKIPNGTYDIKKRIIVDNLKYSVALRGSGKSNLNIYETGFLFLMPMQQELTVTGSSRTGDNFVKVSNIENIEVGDVVRLYSDSAWETGWGYKENDTHIVKSIAGKSITFKDSLIFNYDPSKETVGLTFSKPISFILQEINMNLPSKDSWVKTEAIVLRSMFVEVKNISVKDQNPNIMHRGFSLVNCPSVNIENIRFENLEYGVLMNYCRNIKATGIKAIKIRHALAPANACINMYASDIYGEGCQGVIDAHQSFGVHYNNINDNNATQFSNCRSLGTKITNSKFTVDSSYYQDYCYWSIQTLTDEYQDFYKKYDVVFDNVEWIHQKASGFNGLTAYSCRNFIINNCRTHNVSLYGNLYGRAVITNSTVGSIRINSTNVDVKNCMLNGNLSKNTPFVFRFSGAGHSNIDSVKAFNYNRNEVNLFEYFYNASNYNSIVIKNSNFEKLKGWTNQLIYPETEYSTLKIENTIFKGFQEALPKKVFNEAIITRSKSNSDLKF